MLISETSASALPLTRFLGLARVPDIPAGVPSSARVAGVALLWTRQFEYLGCKNNSSRGEMKKVVPVQSLTTA